MTDRNELYRYAESIQEEMKDFLRAFAPIPAPSNHEEKRVEFLLNYYRDRGVYAYSDAAKNVIVPYGVTEGNEVVVIMAHTDVVFPDETPLPFSEDPEYFYCPGISDDTASYAQLLFCSRFFMENKKTPKCGILFIANACEEGLGNLKGSREILKTFGKRIRAWISIDSPTHCIVTRAVGSARYEVKLRTEGGHSYSAFGNRNAIHAAAELITDLYTVEVPVKGDSKTTYNVGIVHGGTSVNTIAQECGFLYEYRSNSRECLAEMKEIFEEIVSAHRSEKVSIEVELLGERPCNGDVDPVKMDQMVKRFEACYNEAAREELGKDFTVTSGSTDANIPLSAGIPAATVGARLSTGVHTRGEKLLLKSLLPSTKYTLLWMDTFFDS